MKLAVICASGIGDALIVHAISHAASLIGWKSTTFSNHLASFGPWLSSKAEIAPQPRLETLEDLLSPFDAIFLQHDNSQKAYKIKSLNLPVYSFYGAHIPSKHGRFEEGRDYVCDRTKSMVENIEAACWKFWRLKPKGNGFIPPSGLIHRRFKRRIAIHPTASTDEKIWPRDEFLTVAKILAHDGYEPVFTVSPLEAADWGSPLFPTLGDLASFVYESGFFLGNDSGTGHLASLLQIPHLIIGGNGLQMPLWKTGWYPGTIVTPPSWLMRIKYFRNRWKQLISHKAVIKKFKESALRN